MNEIKITVDSNKVQNISKEISENLKKFNESKIGPYEFKAFAIYVTDDTENIIGGIKGELFDRICMIQTVWIHEKYRKKGLGTQTFKKLEEFARENNCQIIQLDTAEFQAKGFYEKIGYSVIANLPSNFKGYTTYIMRKTI